MFSRWLVKALMVSATKITGTWIAAGRLIPNRHYDHFPFLQYCRTVDMVFHMKTTLNIDDTVMAQLKREAARQKRTMSELVETALRSLFRSQKKRHELPPLPTFHGGGALVDVADRDALYQAMEGR